MVNFWAKIRVFRGAEEGFAAGLERNSNRNLKFIVSVNQLFQWQQ